MTHFKPQYYLKCVFRTYARLNDMDPLPYEIIETTKPRIHLNVLMQINFDTSKSFHRNGDLCALVCTVTFENGYY